MSNNVKFFSCFDSRNINRMDFLEITKNSYIQKMSIFTPQYNKFLLEKKAYYI